jgi:XRE family aerobic/anaerobic benzoate catabolism transcriptional regulator
MNGHYTAGAMEPLLEDLGRRVRELRQKAGLSIRELSDRSSLSPRFLADVEAGSGNISVLKLDRLARALGTSAAMLLEMTPTVSRPVVALLGIRGAGKTTIGMALARRTDVPFVELDGKIEERSGLSLAEIFALHGESYYRRLEQSTLESILAENAPKILATGGGIVTSPRAYGLLLKQARTIWLKASPEDHWNRVVGQGDRRPMGRNPEARAELERLIAAREPLYEKAAHTLVTSGLTVEEAVARLASLLQAKTSAA